MIVTVTLNPCVDRTIYVDEVRIGQIIRAHRCDVIAGGKGNNVARVLKALGEPVRPVVLVGGETGQLIGRLLRERDGLEPVVCPISEPSREVVTVLEETTGVQTAYVEPGPHVTPEEVQAFIHRVTSSFDDADVVVLSGSVPSPSMTDIYARLIRLARQRGARAVLDTRDEALRLGFEARPDILNCNRVEAEKLLDRPVADLVAAAGAARELSARGADRVTITLGADGFVACSSTGTWHVSPPDVEVTNPVGAGDALVAGFTFGVLRGLSSEALLRFAQAVAAASLGHWHAGVVDPKDVPGLLPQVRLQKL